MGKKLSPEQAAATDAAFNERYPTAKPQWSFRLSTVLDKPLNEVVSKLGGLDNFETLSRLNPVCVEYTEASRDEVVLPGPLEGARVRELPAFSSSDVAEVMPVEGGRKYRRINFKAKDRLTVFWGLLAGIVQQRGTFVWDEEKKLGLWEVTTTDTPGLETWAKKLVRFVDAGDGKTRVEEFLEGYSKESLQIFEGLAKMYTKNLHKDWSRKYSNAFNP